MVWDETGSEFMPRKAGDVGLEDAKAVGLACPVRKDLQLETESVEMLLNAWGLFDRVSRTKNCRAELGDMSGCWATLQFSSCTFSRIDF